MALLPVILLSLVLNVLIFLGLSLLIVPGVNLAVMFSVAIPACIVERQRIRSAMRRCAHLTSDDRWPAFGLQAIFVISLIVVVGGFNLVFAFAGAVEI
ncbi:MAG: hypothetical protein CMM46_03570 [Rhodospirillaceae bacterium]|nr:hypothetical protein [Rhodospirillaceae bacterium]|tara:strand:+ start:15700 stop:15993 length:294 start_codon:yes stop_codon:yes gene_type:complete